MTTITKTATKRKVKSSEESFKSLSSGLTSGIKKSKKLCSESIKSITVHDIKNISQNLWSLLEKANDLETARKKVFFFLGEMELNLLNSDKNVHYLERSNARNCINAFRLICSSSSEKRTDCSALDALWKMAQKTKNKGKINTSEIDSCFLSEIFHLLKGIHCQSGLYTDDTGGTSFPEYLSLQGRARALGRSQQLDEIGLDVIRQMSRYPSGLDDRIIKIRNENKNRILKFFGAKPDDWNDPWWHIKHIVIKSEVLEKLIQLAPDLKKAIDICTDSKIPFGITPYYISLMDETGDDHQIRSQVIPPFSYAKQMAEHRNTRNCSFDFMGEHDTSPEDLITRRYPHIAILKPFNTCAQICVYCQRNWEIEECMDSEALASRERIDKAIEWFSEHPSMRDCLITGGDPVMMKDEDIEYVLSKVSAIPHIERIRIGTRTPVVLPQRWTPNLLSILSKYHKPSKRQIQIITHFEQSYEITPETADTIKKIRELGISVYNQEVFTMENSRRFESAKLRRDLKLIGVDPYYTFNMKGKEETTDYRVPIARLLQERREEARLLPGLDRTDEPVFNVPRMGKNHVRAWNDHQIIMIRPSDGQRLYEFHPWDKNVAVTLKDPYIYADVPILDYLERLKKRGEDPNDYDSIWYYY